MDKILAELEERGLIQRQEFKNRYGAADGLWKLGKNNLIWENFSLSGSTVNLICNDQLLGSVPRVSLRESAQNAFLQLNRQTIFQQQLPLEFQDREWKES